MKKKKKKKKLLLVHEKTFACPQKKNKKLLLVWKNFCLSTMLKASKKIFLNLRKTRLRSKNLTFKSAKFNCLNEKVVG